MTKVKKANILNNFFCSITDIANSDSDLPNIDKRTDQKLDFNLLTYEEVKNIPETLQIGKAVVCDYSSRHMLKHTANTVCKPLSTI